MSASPLTSQQRSAIAGRLTLWNSPDEALRPEPVTTDGFIPTASGRVKPSDVDATGHSASVRSCIAFPTPPLSLALRSAWIPTHATAAPWLFDLRARRCVCPMTCGSTRLSGRNRHRSSRQLFAPHDRSHDRPSHGAEVARVEPIRRQPRSRRAPPRRWPDYIRRRAEPLVVPVG